MSTPSTDTLIVVAIAVGLIAITVIPYVRSLRHREETNVRRLQASVEAGLDEPPTLHPVVDPEICLGSGACVAACPEGDILGLVRSRPELLHASRCVGHGQCAAACPVSAITLVFGTAQRGVDIPHVKGDFETNVPGIYIVGELGGMGLIRNALRQGRQAVEGIARHERATDDALDVLIVGAGPAGISASLAAMQAGLRFATVEQELPGGAVRHYPRQKLVMTEPMDIPLYGRVDLPKAGKEELLSLWDDVFTRTGLQVRSGERLEGARRDGGVFHAVTSKAEYRARHLVLAIGRRGTPRRLGVPGEERDKVAYFLLEPERYRGQAITVVGGGNTALETACALAAVGPETRVTLVHRSAALARATEVNRERFAQLQREGRVELLLQTAIGEIGADHVRLTDAAGVERQIDNDQVFVCIGGELPVPFLTTLGITVERKFGQA